MNRKFFNLSKHSRAVYTVNPHVIAQPDSSFFMNFEPTKEENRAEDKKDYFNRLLEMLIRDFHRMSTETIQVNSDIISIPDMKDPSTAEYDNQIGQFKEIDTAVDKLFISHFKTYKIEVVDFIRYFFHQGGLIGMSEVFFAVNHIEDKFAAYYSENFKHSSAYSFQEQVNGSVDLVVDTTFQYEPQARQHIIKGAYQPIYCVCPRENLYSDVKPESETSTLQIRYNIDFKAQTGVALQIKEYKMNASPKLAEIDKMRAHSNLIPRLLANFINFLSSFFNKPKEIAQFQHSFELNKYQYERETLPPKLSRS